MITDERSSSAMLGLYLVDDQNFKVNGSLRKMASNLIDIQEIMTAHLK